MRPTVAIVFLAAASAWAGGQPLTWEPARIVRVEEAVASGVLAPTDPHPAFFDFFSDAIPESDGSVVFIANRAEQGVSVLGREGVYAIDRDGRPSVLIQRGDKIGDSSAAAVIALEMQDGVPAVRCMLEDGTKETLKLEINRTEPGSPTGHNAVGRKSELVGDERSIRWISPDGIEQIVADLTTRIPDLFDGTFTRFEERAVTFDSWVIFSGSSRSYEGLFAMNMATSRLYLLLDNRASLGARRIEDFQISMSPRAGEEVAVTVAFADGGSGIYLFRFSDTEGKSLFGNRD